MEMGQKQTVPFCTNLVVLLRARKNFLVFVVISHISFLFVLF